MDQRDLEEAFASNRKLHSSAVYKNLMEIINTHFKFDPEKIFMLYEIPEQGEDIYTLAIDGGRVVTVEIERSTGKYSIEEDTIENFRRKTPRHKLLNRRINVAKYLTTAKGK